MASSEIPLVTLDGWPLHFQSMVDRVDLTVLAMAARTAKAAGGA
jgi:hypothetical protein